MYVLNVETLRKAARQRGFDGLAPLLRQLGLHRNALVRYAKGASVLPESITALIESLELPLDKALQHIVDHKEKESSPYELAAELHRALPNASIVFFGSRSRGTNREYSDFDLGVYSEQKISFNDYLSLVKIKEEFEDKSPYYFDVVDLTRADKSFLRQILPDLKLLAGYQKDLVSLQKAAS